MKTLNQYWTLEDEEFTVTVVSEYNLLQDRHSESFLQVMNRYDLREIKLKKISRGVSYPEQLPLLPYGDLFFIEAKLGTMPGYTRIQHDIASWCKLAITKVHVSGDGELYTPEKTSDQKSSLGLPGETNLDPTIQDNVGEARVKRLLDYMKGKSDDRRKAGEDRDKVFVTNHAALKEHTGVGYTKGFYKCALKEGKVVMDRKVKSWPDSVTFLGTATEIDQLVETTKTEKSLMEQWSNLEQGPDYKYLIETACEEMEVIHQQKNPEHCEQEYQVEQKSDTEYEVKCDGGLVLLGKLQSLLSQFGGSVQALSMTKQGERSMVSLTVVVGDNSDVPQNEEPATDLQGFLSIGY